MLVYLSNSIGYFADFFFYLSWIFKVKHTFYYFVLHRIFHFVKDITLSMDMLSVCNANFLAIPWCKAIKKHDVQGTALNEDGVTQRKAHQSALPSFPCVAVLNYLFILIAFFLMITRWNILAGVLTSQMPWDCVAGRPQSECLFWWKDSWLWSPGLKSFLWLWTDHFALLTLK